MVSKQKLEFRSILFLSGDKEEIATNSTKPLHFKFEGNLELMNKCNENLAKKECSRIDSNIETNRVLITPSLNSTDNIFQDNRKATPPSDKETVIINIKKENISLIRKREKDRRVYHFYLSNLDDSEKKFLIEKEWYKEWLDFLKCLRINPPEIMNENLISTTNKIRITKGELIGETLFKYLFSEYDCKSVIQYISEDKWKIMNKEEFISEIKFSPNIIPLNIDKFIFNENEESKEGTNFNTPNTKEENLDDVDNYIPSKQNNKEFSNKKMKRKKIPLEISTNLGNFNLIIKKNNEVKGITNLGSSKPSNQNQNIDNIDSNVSLCKEEDKTENEDKSEIPPCGISNPSNFCYINASLQCLLSTFKIGKYFLNKLYKENSKDCISKTQRSSAALYETINQMIKAGFQSHIEGKEIRRIISKYMNINIQQDAHEFLIKFMSLLQDEENIKILHNKIQNLNIKDAISEYKLYNRSLIDKLFSGFFSNEVKCLNCNNLSYALDPFIDINLPINSDNLSKKNLICLMAKFFKEEVIPISSGYKCEKCKKKVKVVKRMIIKKEPQNLIIHLKRFSSIPVTHKINGHISFPFNLDIGKFHIENKSLIYDLYGVCSHTGLDNFGHYVSFCKRSNSWYLFNDQRVTRINETKVLNTEAYLLFYRKISSVIK